MPTDLEKAAYVAENVLEWCRPIGQYNHMAWYQECGAEIAKAIREDLDGAYKISLDANAIPAKEHRDG